MCKNAAGRRASSRDHGLTELRTGSTSQFFQMVHFATSAVGTGWRKAFERIAIAWRGCLLGQVGDQDRLAGLVAGQDGQEQSCPLLEVSLGGVPEPIVSQLVKPHGQDVHEESAEELDPGQSAGLPLALDRLTGVGQGPGWQARRPDVTAARRRRPSASRSEPGW